MTVGGGSNVASSSASVWSIRSDLATDFERDRGFFLAVSWASKRGSSSSSSTFFNADRLELLVLFLGVLADDLREPEVERGLRGVLAVVVVVEVCGASDSSSSSPSKVLVGRTAS